MIKKKRKLHYHTLRHLAWPVYTDKTPRLRYQRRRSLNLRYIHLLIAKFREYSEYSKRYVSLINYMSILLIFLVLFLFNGST